MKDLPLLDVNTPISNVTFKCLYSTGKDPNQPLTVEKEIEVNKSRAELELEFPSQFRGKLYSLRADIEYKDVQVGESITVDHPAGKFNYTFDRKQLPYFTMELRGKKGGTVMTIDSLGLVNAPVLKLQKELNLLFEDHHETVLPVKKSRSVRLSITGPKKFPRKIFRYPTTISCEVFDDKAQFKAPAQPFDPDQLLLDEQK